MSNKLSITKKLQILQKLSKAGESQSSVAKIFGVSRKTVQNVISNKELLKQADQFGVNQNRCQLKVGQKFDDVNKATYEWFVRMREKHGEIPVVESVVCRKAIQFASILEVNGFKTSKGWFSC